MGTGDRSKTPSETLAQEIDWVRGVIERTRSAFLVANVASLIVLVALFNVYITSMQYVRARESENARTLVQLHAPQTQTPEQRLAIDMSVKKLEALLRSDMQDLKVSSIPLLGLKVFGGDLGLLSAIAMLVLSVWLYYAFRREQHCVARLILRVGSIKMDGKEPGKLYDYFNGGAPEQVSVALRNRDPECGEHVLWALSTSFLFTTSKIDQAVGESRKNEVNRYAEEGPPVAIVAKSILFFAPLYVVVLAVLADVASLFWPSKLIGGESLWSAMDGDEQGSVIVKTLVCAFIIVLIHSVLRRAVYFAVWTQTIYRALALAVHNTKKDRGEFDIPWADEQEEKVGGACPTEDRSGSF